MQSSTDTRQLIDYAVRAIAIDTSVTGGEVYSRFQSEPNTPAIAVVDEVGRPVGIVDRNAFFLKMGAEFGRALYGKRPVTSVMEAPRVEHQHASVMEYMGGALLRDPASLLKAFIVVDDDGRYLAIGTPLTLLEAGYVAANARIDELRRLTAELAVKEQEAQAAARAKSSFLATMSHEIRTPLNGVLAVAEILDKKLKQEELRHYVRTILNSGCTLHRLLSDALDLSRGEAGAISLACQDLELAPLAEETEALWQPLAEQKGLTFRVDCEIDADLDVHTDGVRLRQVINNLIGNALKFTSRGEVSVRLEARRSGDLIELEMDVADTGQGIAPDQLERIFEPFAKVNEHQGGAGLGLSICRQIVDAMDGRIGATSKVGKGSTFEVRLSLPPATGLVVAPEQVPDTPAEPIETANAVAADAARVLIVDDNETNRLVARTFIEMAGMSWTLAENGAQAVERAGVEAFDLILMDIKMPVMDGVSATRAIRGTDGPNRDTPILALTANTDPADQVTYKGAGMSGLVGKPLKSEDLFSAIARLAEDEIAANAA